jgi:predicted small lipoprotein YifL
MVPGGSRGGVRSRVLARAARHAAWWIATILAGSLLAACGQRGPLYLPKPPAEPASRVRTPSSGAVVVPPARTPAEAAPGTPSGDAERPARRPD